MTFRCRECDQVAGIRGAEGIGRGSMDTGIQDSNNVPSQKTGHRQLL